MTMFHKLYSVKFLKKFGKAAISVTSHIKIRIKADQPASYFAKSGLLIIILILHDHLNNRVFNLLTPQHIM